jgi:hypothetical protein
LEKLVVHASRHPSTPFDKGGKSPQMALDPKTERP